MIHRRGIFAHDFKSSKSEVTCFWSYPLLNHPLALNQSKPFWFWEPLPPRNLRTSPGIKNTTLRCFHNFIFLDSQRVGCDLRIGSTKKIDSCGVCGGDGSTCTQPLYHWEIAGMSVCSVTCGGGKWEERSRFRESNSITIRIHSSHQLQFRLKRLQDGNSNVQESFNWSWRWRIALQCCLTSRVNSASV